MKIHPPRYFVGFLDLSDGRRLQFANSILIPVTRSAAHIYAGSSDSAYYADGVAHVRARSGGSTVVAIQYAISVLVGLTDAKPVIQQFNHEFEKPARLTLAPAGSYLILSALPGILYRSQALDTLLRGVGASKIPVTQFIG